MPHITAGGFLCHPLWEDGDGGRGWGCACFSPLSVAQMGTNKCASQSGMTAYGTRRHLYDPKNQILPPMDHSTISLQMGTNKCASQVSQGGGGDKMMALWGAPC